MSDPLEGQYRGTCWKSYNDRTHDWRRGQKEGFEERQEDVDEREDHSDDMSLTLAIDGIIIQTLGIW